MKWKSFVCQKHVIRSLIVIFNLSFYIFHYGLAFAGEPDNPVFEKTLEEIREKAKASQKGIIVLYYADWCGFCKKLKTETLVDKEVIATMNAGFYSYQVLNSSDEGIAFKGAFNINSLPTFLFFDENGDIKTISSGFFNKEEFILLLKKIYRVYYQKKIS